MLHIQVNIYTSKHISTLASLIIQKHNERCLSINDAAHTGKYMYTSIHISTLVSQNMQKRHNQRFIRDKASRETSQITFLATQVLFSSLKAMLLMEPEGYDDYGNMVYWHEMLGSQRGIFMW